MIAATLICFGSASAHAADGIALPKAGHFYGYGTVALIDSKGGSACPVAMGDNFAGVFHLRGWREKGSFFGCPLPFRLAWSSRRTSFQRRLRRMCQVPVTT